MFFRFLLAQISRIYLRIILTLGKLPYKFSGTHVYHIYELIYSKSVQCFRIKKYCLVLFSRKKNGMSLILDIRCYSQEEFSFLTLRDLHNLVIHGHLCVNITCKITPHLFTSTPDPSFCQQILSLVFLSSLHQKNLSENYLVDNVLFHI